jgi:hypothetical protein
MYLKKILQKYKAKDLADYVDSISALKKNLKMWANSCYIEILESGSKAKGTAISLSSDVDYLVSLKSSCNENNGGLQSIYNSLYMSLNENYSNIRKQNVSIRININGLKVDITPARKQPGNTNDHNLYVSKTDTWKKTNIQKHISDVSQSRRTNEIKLLKIWRELNNLDFPSIYVEYLTINNILLGKYTNDQYLNENFLCILSKLGEDEKNPLFTEIVDPANSNNILSDLLNTTEKKKIISAAKKARNQKYWENIVW